MAKLLELIPARLQWREGVPAHGDYDDVYHSVHGALAQSRHVFLGGTGLPQAWAGRAHFAILETGFGLGGNFLATWAAWRSDPRRAQRLDFVSLEKHPLTAEDWRHVWAQGESELRPLALTLGQRLPPLVPGIHTVEFDEGRVRLFLVYHDAAAIEEIEGRFDAVYLDGFAPTKNPAMWSEPLLAAVARRMKPGARLATWCAAGEVRRRLAAAGLSVRPAPGFAGKREMTIAWREGMLAEERRPARVVVIGAGMAGANLAHALARRGVPVTLFERESAPGQGASGNLAGVLRWLPSADDNRLSRWTRAGTLAAHAMLREWEAQGIDAPWGPNGVAHLARDEAQARKQRATLERLAPPSEVLTWLDAATLSERIGWPVAQGGWWFELGGWIGPQRWCRRLLELAGPMLTLRCATAVGSIEPYAPGWRVRDAEGKVLEEADAVVLAAGAEVSSFAQAAGLPIRPARGQVSLAPAEVGSPPRVTVCRNGYVTPEVSGRRAFGATLAVDDPDPAVRASDHRENLAKLEAILPGYTAGLDFASLEARVGFRPTVPDRLPVVGPLGETPGLFILSGFGARGLAFAVPAARLAAAMLCGEPWPLERTTALAADPARFFRR
ncbi:FAD-dependent 5-carboxymethylaminomethyl-2-thiouridine(34) oxidoreductase MnmC [Tepidiphilus margaritifer]|uniref:FAD-dependent 5-carboxymethylaminomethyl-2-thiouridine(34) oxidoreductase MnmC n=1 Tax=Tepidiphilus margaritifer TaxID=203471 RepID=UPI00055BBB1D|nr:FAD-dependent 5-carboxymethylaminomethyl-2-thiouridine(34) oxidoreductase MnmC [Tepidiphilus margaritifer]